MSPELETVTVEPEAPERRVPGRVEVEAAEAVDWAFSDRPCPSGEHSYFVYEPVKDLFLYDVIEVPPVVFVCRRCGRWRGL